MIESSTLYTKPNIWTGVASILDLGATLTEYNCLYTPEEMDYKALEHDFKMIATDIQLAIVQ